MKKVIRILFLLMSVEAFSQGGELPYEKNFSSYQDYHKKEYGVSFDNPDNLKMINEYRTPFKIRKDPDKCVGTALGPFFLSKDKNCMIALTSFLSNVNAEHSVEKDVNSIKSAISLEILTSLGGYYCPNSPLNARSGVVFENYVSTILGKMPREMFNADYICVYDLPNADSLYFFDEPLEELRRKKYPYCTGVIINKNRRESVSVKMFFTEKGNKNKAKYFDLLRKLVWYNTRTGEGEINMNDQF